MGVLVVCVIASALMVRALESIQYPRTHVQRTESVCTITQPTNFTIGGFALGDSEQSVQARGGKARWNTKGYAQYDTPGSDGPEVLCHNGVVVVLAGEALTCDHQVFRAEDVRALGTPDDDGLLGWGDVRTSARTYKLCNLTVVYGHMATGPIGYELSSIGPMNSELEGPGGPVFRRADIPAPEYHPERLRLVGKRRVVHPGKV